MQKMIPFVISAEADAKQIDRAQKLALELGVEPQMADSDEEDPVSGIHLRMGVGGLSLVDDKLEMRGDLTSMLPRLKVGRLQGELLVKAAKIKGREELLAVDATAGMGEDALLLAASGFQVILYEYDPVIAALLEDSLERAKDDPALAPVVANMTLRKANSVEEMPEIHSMIGRIPDVILLDPMFPERNKSGLIKKKFQLLQQLESPCCEEAALLEAAKAAKPDKIVIKRPLKGPNLAGEKPDYSITGKAIRYDVLMTGIKGKA